MAARRVTTTYHPGHVAERYGLFTIIVLGEGVLASAGSVIEAIGQGSHVPALVALAAAVSAGIEVQVAAITGPEHVGALAARASVLVPTALFVAAVAAIVLRPHLGRDGAVACAVAVLLLLPAAALPLPPVAVTAVAAVVVAALVAVLAAVRSVRGSPETSAAPTA